ncbi:MULTISPECIES: DUF2897 family protein [Marinobacter]|uniref:DUF2897 domain-containing protein n=1 Tax=Marinobacter profundi TaxID=2666256 RepID=A0A2G1UNJ0_9GAMM|nr:MULTISPECIES: DUF2897 family protein [Marinobacter]MBD3655055.1 DUF2897 family protein [Marinobacter sp.]PHQ15969.1 DUF2897 domain-containing protein [Marinobacter profundi]
MPAIGWIILLAALGMIVGSLFLLRDTARHMPLSEEKLEKIRKRKAELEAREKDED